MCFSDACGFLLLFPDGIHIGVSFYPSERVWNQLRDGRRAVLLDKGGNLAHLGNDDDDRAAFANR